MAATPVRHTLTLRGHRLDLDAVRVGRGTRLTLRADDRVVLERAADPARTVVPLAEIEDLGLDLAELALAGLNGKGARLVVFGLRPGRPSTVKLVNGSTEPSFGPRANRPEVLPFEPPADSWAHRRYRFRTRHPNLYAARHVAVAAGQVAILLLGVKIALDLLPWGRIPWPDWRPPRPPRLNLPDLPLPEISLPGWQLPGWVRAVLAAKPYWLPFVIGIFIALGEVARRRKRRAADGQATGKDGP